MDQNILEEQLMALVLQTNYQPVKPRVLAKKLKLSEEDARQLKRLIKKLAKRGVLKYGENHRIASPTATTATATGAVATTKTALPAAERSDNRITGVFRRAASGFGFVRPAGAAPGHLREHDYFVAERDAHDAATGDLVLLRPSKGKNGGPGGRNPQAVIVEIIERATRAFVGTYLERGGEAFVKVDGSAFANLISVGDPGAKNARPDDKVVFEMVRFPGPSNGGEGVITEVLGARGEPGVDTLSIIREFNLPEQFPPDVVEAAREEAARFDERDLNGRVDYTAETIITIDPVDARDFDDAISLSRNEKGHWVLGVHIADVAHFVRPGEPLDREAYERGTSVYLPDRVLPMLPEIVSNGLASLQPYRVRYARTALLEFTPEGIRVSSEVQRTAIKSKRRFSYEEIDEFLADRKPWKEKLTPEVFNLVEKMHELAMILRARRIKRGSLELSMDEVKIDLDRDGRVTGAHKVEQTVSHQIIEEYMLAANDAVAELLEAQEWFFLRRVHGSPDPRKMAALTTFVTELGFKVESLEDRFELQRLLKQVADRPERHAVNYAVLRSLQRAVYSPEDEGHYALASETYCHFTSPIRRYPDLTIHRLTDALLTGKKPRNDFGELVVAGQHCSDRERRAEAGERELKRVKLLEYCSTRIGLELDGVVTGVEEFGLFVQGIELPAEGLLHVNSLQDDFYHFERRSHSLVGRRAGNAFRLGDKLRVAVARVDVDRRNLDFRLAERKESAPPIRPPRRERPARAAPTPDTGKPKAAAKGKARPPAQGKPRKDASKDAPKGAAPKGARGKRRRPG